MDSVCFPCKVDKKACKTLSLSSKRAPLSSTRPVYLLSTQGVVPSVSPPTAYQPLPTQPVVKPGFASSSHADPVPVPSLVVHSASPPIQDVFVADIPRTEPSSRKRSYGEMTGSAAPSQTKQTKKHRSLLPGHRQALLISQLSWCLLATNRRGFFRH